MFSRIHCMALSGIDAHPCEVEIDVTFESACLGKACPDAAQCVAGTCEDRQIPGPFDDPSIVDTGVLCVDPPA